MRKSLQGVSAAALGLITLATTGLWVAACDGTAWTGPTGVDQSPSGIYTGSFTSTVTQPSPARQVIGVVSEDFDAQFLLAEQHYAGNLVVEGASLSGVLMEYNGRQGVFVGSGGSTIVSIEGEVTARDGMFGTYTGDTAEGRFALTYSETYEEGAPLAVLSGIWSYSESLSGGGVYTVTLEIDGNGQLFATDTAGCVFNGQLTAIDDSYSAYRVVVDVSACGAVNGDYGGLAFYQSAAEVLHIGADNGQLALAVRFGRL